MNWIEAAAFPVGHGDFGRRNLSLLPKFSTSVSMVSLPDVAANPIQGLEAAPPAAARSWSPQSPFYHQALCLGEGVGLGEPERLTGQIPSCKHRSCANNFRMVGFRRTFLPLSADTTLKRHAGR